MTRRDVSGTMIIAIALLAACGGSGDAVAESPPSVLSTERAQDAIGQPRPGAAGVVRTVELSVGGVPVTAEIADTPALRERGLMERESLPEDHGMLFVYPDEQTRSFWMRNTPIPLDIAFIDRSLSVINIETAQANSDDNVVSERGAMYVLEMTAGWFDAHGLAAGTRVQF